MVSRLLLAALMLWGAWACGAKADSWSRIVCPDLMNCWNQELPATNQTTTSGYTPRCADGWVLVTLAPYVFKCAPGVDLKDPD